jgi:signal transduction histidine kinase
MGVKRRRGKRRPANETQEQHAFLQTLADETRVLTSGQASALCLVDSSRTRIRLAAGSGTFADHVGDEAPVGDGLSGHMLASPDTVQSLSCQTACCPFAPSSSHHHIAVLIRAGNQIRGVLCATSAVTSNMGRNWEAPLLHLARMAGSCLVGERVCRLAEDLGALTARQHIAADMHDGIAQSMVTVHMQLDRALGELADRGDSWPRLLTVRDTLTGTIEELRTMIESLQNPRDLTHVLEGLADVLHSAAHDADMSASVISVRAGHDVLVLPAAAEEVRRIVIEALTNANRHAHASAISVSLGQEGGEAVVRVADNGRGIAGSVPGVAASSSAPARHFGVDTMHLRAAVLGGWLEIRSDPGQGTEVILRWPQPAI